MVWATGSLPPCGGELGLVQLGMVGSWMIAIPASLFALVAALTVKDGSPSLRKMCFVTSAVVLIAPIITSILFPMALLLRRIVSFVPPSVQILIA